MIVCNVEVFLEERKYFGIRYKPSRFERQCGDFPLGDLQDDRSVLDSSELVDGIVVGQTLEAVSVQGQDLVT